ncbi:MAG: DUF1203 domain-containing protein [Chthoniobacterales bacterium]
MKTTDFRVIPLPTEVAEAARRAAKTGASDHAYVTVDSPTGYPCRHCLQWGKPGEELVLFPYASIPAGSPYAESGPIFVHAEPCPRYEKTDEYPADFRGGRVLRAYNSSHNMIAAEVVGERHPETVIESLFADPETEFLQARSADRACYTFAMNRA